MFLVVNIFQVRHAAPIQLRNKHARAFANYAYKFADVDLHEVMPSVVISSRRADSWKVKVECSLCSELANASARCALWFKFLEKSISECRGRFLRNVGKLDICCFGNLLFSRSFSVAMKRIICLRVFVGSDERNIWKKCCFYFFCSSGSVS